MNQVEDNVSSVSGCVILIFSGVIVGGFWIGLLLINNFNLWLISFGLIISIYVLRYARYIFIKPTLKSFYLGRQLCFLTFPSFSNIIFLFFWHQTHSWPISVASSIIIAWFISRGLQKTLFACEYTYRDNPQNRKISSIKNYTYYNPIQASQLNIQGIKLAKQGFYKEAQQNFEQAIELDPDNPNQRINISNILIRDGRFTEAESQLRKALQMSPTKPNEQNIYNNLANLSAAKKNYPEALTCYKKSIAVYKPDHEIYYNLALTLEQLGEWEEALHYFELSDKDPANKKAKLGKIRVEQRMKRSFEMTNVLNFNKDCNIVFPNCGNYSLLNDELKTIEALDNSPLVFFVGAGISFPYPSCLPIASDILKIIFHYLYEIDKKEISKVLKVSTEKEAYEKLCIEFEKTNAGAFNGSCCLPFESTFQALYDSFGFPVVRFVDLLTNGKPNLHHHMLATAIEKGHTVITTNFDKKIEAAFKGSNLKVLISDKDFQCAIDNSLYDGLLAKIHGDISDYGSLALTMSGVAVGSDKSMYLGDDIDEEKGKQQLQQVCPRTFLSIPKALWLQNVLRQKKICVMGYSGSDKDDIMPILTNLEYECRGLWVEYEFELPNSVKIWAEINDKRKILKPKNENDKKYDIPSKVSRYFLNQFGNSFKTEANEKIDSKIINTEINSWIDRLRLKPGDGLVFLAMLYSQRGLWFKAKELYSKAMAEYETDIKSNEHRWLLSKSNMGYILDQLDEKDEALKLANEIRDYIENSQKQDLYPSYYAKNLIDIARQLKNTDRDNEAGLLIDKAMKIAEEIGDKQEMCYGFRIAADRYLAKKDYKNALKLYLRVYKLNSDVFGDIRESCLSSINAAFCFAHLGNQYTAYQMIAQAVKYANYLGDQKLIEQVKHNAGFIYGFFIGKSPVLKLHEELIAKARKGIGKKNEKEIDELHEHIVNENYDQCFMLIDRLLKKYENIDVKSLLIFLKANIYRRTDKTEREIDTLYEFCKLKPNNPLAEHNLGQASSKIKKYDIAEKHFLKAIELMGGNYPLAYCNLGIMYADWNRIKDAKEQLEKAEKMEAPENSLNILRKRISEINEEKRDV